jgi:hypothetical protein
MVPCKNKNISTQSRGFFPGLCFGLNAGNHSPVDLEFSQKFSGSLQNFIWFQEWDLMDWNSTDAQFGWKNWECANVSDVVFKSIQWCVSYVGHSICDLIGKFCKNHGFLWLCSSRPLVGSLAWRLDFMQKHAWFVLPQIRKLNCNDVAIKTRFFGNATSRNLDFGHWIPLKHHKNIMKDIDTPI